MPTIYVTKKTRQRKNKDGSNAPQPVCETCGIEIAVGEPHKNVSVRSGSYSVVRVRCMNEPNWHSWELSSSLSARLEEVAYNFDQALGASLESVSDVESALSDAAEAIREIASEKRESASNIEEGFGHATYQSDDMNEQADALESWADEIEACDVPEFPEPEEQECPDCDGGFEITFDGRTVGICKTCNGTHLITLEEPTEEQMDAWRDEVSDAVSIVEESPV